MRNERWVLGVDPGATTGWVLYDRVDRMVIESGEFRDVLLSPEIAKVIPEAGQVVLERPRGQGSTRPQVVECGITFGRLFEMMRALNWETHWLYRLTVCQRLTFALHGTIVVRNDSTAWAALVALHGPNSDSRGKVKKGQFVEPAGAIGRLGPHAKAALATAVALHLPDPPKA